jgi:hypothetical protein
MSLSFQKISKMFEGVKVLKKVQEVESGNLRRKQNTG